ncbi:hypothetical protein V1512DRAFT_222456 [Lipomyces arxii]|uniref:uncharacterized protein n=1 Tax=Lipomyces arxii TaxID=56418 RepID=UPI0034CF8FF2
MEAVKKENAAQDVKVRATTKMSEKRSHEGDDEPRKKKGRVLKHEQAYLANLPSYARYTRSFMHREHVSFVSVASDPNFALTVSDDGRIKVWKKRAKGVEFVKEFKAHEGRVAHISLGSDGKLFASAGGEDKKVSVLDVASFDVINILSLPYTPHRLCWLYRTNQAQALLAVTDRDSPRILIYDARGDGEPVHVLPDLHRAPVAAIGFNHTHNCAVSVDNTGMVEYWRPDSAGYEKPPDVFEFKTSTDLYEFRKTKCVPTSIEFSRSGRHFAAFSLPDRQVRVFDYFTGKLHRKYDESLQTAAQANEDGTAMKKLDDIEFGRRIAAERELERDPVQCGTINAVFDDSGNFLIYPTPLGIKLVNIVTNRCIRLFGSEDNVRFLNMSLYQGAPNRKGIMTLEMATAENALVNESLSTDPTLFATGMGKNRFYMFTSYDGDFATIRPDRDVNNERLIKDPSKAEEQIEAKAELSRGATLHTTLGDIQIRLYPEHAPLAVENFITLCRKKYYDGLIFHRVIKKFMVQTGDPVGDGTGGESMWGHEFKDEFSVLRHDRPFTVSMANAGPDTNGSQFFITTEKTPWLDDKHTIFGRVVMGMDVVKRIEGLKVDRYDKPEDPPSILSTTVL